MSVFIVDYTTLSKESINVCIYCQREHNFKNTVHSIVIYYMFRQMNVYYSKICVFSVINTDIDLLTKRVDDTKWSY
jgi:hypothetical protein